MILTKNSIAVYLTANLGFVLSAASSAYLIYLDGILRVLGIIGLFVGLYINWHFKHKADKRADELHNKTMEPKDNG